ncbi:molybdopterin synthase large subunit [Niveomyces insectorum RCEF 264]|uniref:Molybdopterin synthase large subunit n=1 Tax=Niveomyces insectorum RCEF 264 TaxID=1081102 RepID=A0A167UL33_9HYPO|nr:molybdopterin synthase large subunit [Niveomyces insectorum RCEF 264]
MAQHTRPPAAADHLVAEGCYVALTEDPLDAADLLARVRSPHAGANVLFSGTTRDNFHGRPVATLRYAAYRPRALQTLRAIAVDVRARFGLEGVAVVHRLGAVPIGVDSILVAVSAPHREAAWRGAETCLEAIKARVEIWKQEVFADHGGDESGESEQKVWRANRDTGPSGRCTGPGAGPGTLAEPAGSQP